MSRNPFAAPEVDTTPVVTPPPGLEPLTLRFPLKVMSIREQFVHGGWAVLVVAAGGVVFTMRGNYTVGPALLIAAFITSFQLARTLRGLGPLGSTMQVQLDVGPTGISMDATVRKATHPWAQLSTYFENAHAIMVRPRKGVNLIIPRRELSEAEEARLRAWLAAMIPTRSTAVGVSRGKLIAVISFLLLAVLWTIYSTIAASNR